MSWLRPKSVPPQATYPPNYLDALLESLHRRNSTDTQHLPFLTKYPHQFHDWYEICTSIEFLIRALRGETRTTEWDKANATTPRARALFNRPPLPWYLGTQLQWFLEGMEMEVLQLGMDVEMNHVRVMRGDPRGRSEEEIVGLRNYMGRRWMEGVRAWVEEVERTQTGLWGERLKEDETRLRQRWMRRGGYGTEFKGLERRWYEKWVSEDGDRAGDLRGWKL
ncbi:hypothetical protein ACLMJK_005745 [Lecanora helva]